MGGTASSGTDYTALGTTVVIPAGAASATKVVTVVNDTLSEVAETVVLTLAAGTGYTMGSPAVATVTIQDDDLRAWTVMIYLDGDNNLESAAIADFAEMAAVNNPNVNIVVQFDRRSGYDNSHGDWTNTKRFLVTPGMNPTAANALQDLGEVNMATPASLQNFITWARNAYPASRYALVLWNHGDGWRDAVSASPLSKGIIGDDTSGDQLEMAELRLALSGATSAGSNRIDVINMDACLMAGLEVAYKLKDLAAYFAGSAELVPGDGNEYQNILSAANLTAMTTAESWASYLVTAYQATYDGWNDQQTYMAGRLAQIGSLSTRVSDLAQLLITNLGAERSNVSVARLGARKYTDDTDYLAMHLTQVTTARQNG